MEGHEDGSELWQIPGSGVAEVAVLCEKVFSLVCSEFLSLLDHQCCFLVQDPKEWKFLISQLCVLHLFLSCFHICFYPKLNILKFYSLVVSLHDSFPN